MPNDGELSKARGEYVNNVFGHPVEFDKYWVRSECGWAAESSERETILTAPSAYSIDEVDNCDQSMAYSIEEVDDCDQSAVTFVWPNLSGHVPPRDPNSQIEDYPSPPSPSTKTHIVESHASPPPTQKGARIIWQPEGRNRVRVLNACNLCRMRKVRVSSPWLFPSSCADWCS